MSRALWVAGIVAGAAAVIGGVAYASSKKTPAGSASGTWSATSSFTKGKRYRVSIPAAAAGGANLLVAPYAPTDGSGTHYAPNTTLPGDWPAADLSRGGAFDRYEFVAIASGPATMSQVPGAAIYVQG